VGEGDTGGDVTHDGSRDAAAVVVNGEAHVVVAGATVADLVSSWCRSPAGVAVARNREVVPRSEWATTALSPRDVVEIVTAAAGG
jgi:sulfur carrier protein